MADLEKHILRNADLWASGFMFPIASSIFTSRAKLVVFQAARDSARSFRFGRCKVKIGDVGGVLQGFYQFEV